MLSIVNIKNELGKNIYIYPLCEESIKSNSIDLKASKFAWSLSTKKSIFDGVNTLIIPPNDTALIYTQEALFVTNRIGGSYVSKIKLTTSGLSPISGNLDAQYIGLSLIPIHNHTNLPKEIRVGSEFVTVTFSYLNTPDYEDTVSHNNPPGHPSVISDFEKIADFSEWEEKNRWCRTKSELYKAMENSDEYKKCKENFIKEQEKFNRKYRKATLTKYTIAFILYIVFFTLLSIPSYFYDAGTVSTFCKSVFENIFIPMIIALLVPFLMEKNKKR